jgi:hypothetical protein
MQTTGLAPRDVVVRRIGVVSVGKIYGAISAAIGLLIGLFFALASMVGAGLSGEDGSTIFGALFGVGAIVFFPVLYGAMGFLGGLLGAALYNVFAGMVGGVSIQLEG